MREQASEAGQQRAEWLDGEERTVAFVDILGFSDVVKKMTQDPTGFRKIALALLGGSAAAVPGNAGDDLFSLLASQEKEDGYCFDLQAAFFSDCAFISARDIAGGADRVLSAVLGYARHLLMHGFFVRGGIACGLAAHRGGVVVGPAVLTAYSMEQKAAVYPRIVIEDAVAERLLALDQKPNATATIRRGEDGLYFVDVLTTLGLREDGAAVLRQARQLIWKRLEDHRSLDIDAKWRWLAVQYNRALKTVENEILPRIERPDVVELPDSL